MSSAVKRIHEDSSVVVGVTNNDMNGPPPIKKKLVYEPTRIGPVSTLEELDIEVLKFQHKKLKQRLEQRIRNESMLQGRIEELEKRQIQDDAVLNVINRYWNQLNEDIRILLQRFDTETSDEAESKNESEATTSFLTQLSTWDKDELDEKLASRVQVSTRAVSKIIQAFDRLQQRSSKLKDALEKTSEEDLDINSELKETNIQLERENKQVQALITSLHERNHVLSLRMKEMCEKLNSEETKADELKNQVDNLNWEITKLVSSNDKLSNSVLDLIEKNKRLTAMCGADDRKETEFSDRKIDVSDTEIVNLQKDNEELKEIANNRLHELEDLHQRHKELLKELEKLKMDMRTLPESVVVETTEYLALQSKFSVVYNDALVLRQSLDETKTSLCTVRNTHLKTIEQMESEELLGQKKLRTEVIQLEDMLNQVRKEYEMLRIEFEQNVATNEQTGPINREMRHLITSLQNHNQQLKGDAQRYRRKYKDIFSDYVKYKRKYDELELRMGFSSSKDSCDTDSCLDGYKEEFSSPGSSSRHDPLSPSSDLSTTPSKNVPNHDGRTPEKFEVRSSELSVEAKIRALEALVKELKSQLKTANYAQAETKLLLDMYRGCSKDVRDKSVVMASERKLKAELEECRSEISQLKEDKREDQRKLADEDALRKIKFLEEQIHGLQKQVAAQKSEEEALISEMDVTGQAFEDMQEQNSRLIQQLREKDDANFKLMSDRIKSNQLHKLSREERDLLLERTKTLCKQVEAQNQVVRKLEEKERVLVSTLAQTEKESIIRLQSCELSKRKAIESAQSAADLKLHLDKYHSQMKEAQQTVAEKTSSLEAESFKTRRLQEEIAMLKRRVEKLNQIEMAGNSDEVMMEEIREYKELLTCPSCKVKRKDAVLNKCFHVFCFDCLRTRYETRQRKCPKCNAGFGVNDYHRLYLT